MENTNIRKMVLISMMTAIICVCSYITIPLPMVPITMQSLAIMITGLLLTPKETFAAVGTYILLGMIGLPVFSGGASGIGTILGPTGGYIIGFLVGAVVISTIKQDGSNYYKNMVAAVVGGIFVVYAIGVTWLGYKLQMDMMSAIKAGALPFLLGDAIKVFAAGTVSKALNRNMKHIYA